MEEKAYKIDFLPTALNEYSALDGHQVKIIDRILDRILKNPDRGKPLVADLSGFYSEASAGHRVVYSFYPERKRIVVAAVGVRKGGSSQDIYESMKKRKLKLLSELIQIEKQMREGKPY